MRASLSVGSRRTACARKGTAAKGLFSARTAWAMPTQAEASRGFSAIASAPWVAKRSVCSTGVAGDGVFPFAVRASELGKFTCPNVRQTLAIVLADLAASWPRLGISSLARASIKRRYSSRTGAAGSADRPQLCNSSPNCLTFLAGSSPSIRLSRRRLAAAANRLEPA